MCAWEWIINFTSNAYRVRPPQTADHQWRRTVCPQGSSFAVLKAESRIKVSPSHQPAHWDPTDHQCYRHFSLPRDDLLPGRSLPSGSHHPYGRQQHLAKLVESLQGSFINIKICRRGSSKILLKYWELNAWIERGDHFGEHCSPDFPLRDGARSLLYMSALAGSAEDHADSPEAK